MEGCVTFIVLCFVASTWCMPSGVQTRNEDGVVVSFNPTQTTSKIVQEGYPIQVHKVTTSDGYILELHRIPYGKRYDPNADFRPVVFLMHGLMGASEAYILLGTNNSIAYNLADAGFDVWMGNARGNILSRQHVSLDPDDDVEKMQFFDFTWEEIGMIDVAAMIDYTLEQTGRDKLHYVGHSQGGTVFLVLMSMRPEYNEKIISSHIMAPAAYMEYFPDPLLGIAAQFTDIIYDLALSIGFIELFPPSTSSNSTLLSTVQNQRSDYCGGDIKYANICRAMHMDTLVGRNDDQANEMTGGGSGGSSLKQIAHYGQNIRDKLFRRYHHGEQRNIELYGTSEPPTYDLSVITCNMTIHYSLNDNLVDERDILAMEAVLPNTVARVISRPTFSHNDFIAAGDAKELVYDYVLTALILDETDYLKTVNPAGAEAEIDTGNIDSGIIPEPVAQTGTATSISPSHLVKLNLIISTLYLLFK